MFNSVVLILFIASVHCQDSEPCASCNVQPIINYNFGTTITLPSSVVVDGQINNSQVTEGQINPSEVIGSLCQKVGSQSIVRFRGTNSALDSGLLVYS